MSTKTKSGAVTFLALIFVVGLGAYLMKTPVGNRSGNEDGRIVFVLIDWQPSPNQEPGVLVELAINGELMIRENHLAAPLHKEGPAKVGDSYFIKVTTISMRSSLACLIGVQKANGDRFIISEQNPIWTDKGESIICQGVVR